MNEEEIRDCLLDLIGHLDTAITQAVDNPLAFFASPIIETIESRCGNLDRMIATRTTSAQGSRVLDQLIWDVRARAGRIQMLLNSASDFYSNCFSESPWNGLEYGMQGEWGAMASTGHLAINC